MPKGKDLRSKERFRLFLYFMPPAIVACVCAAALFPTDFFPVNSRLFISAAIGLIIGALMAYAISGFLLDHITRIRSGINERFKDNLSETASEKNKLETILKQINDGILTVGIEGEIIHANVAAKLILRMSDDDVKLKKYDDIILRFSDDLTIEQIFNYLAQGNYGAAFSYGGSEYEVRFDKFMAGNQEAGVIIIMRDVTEQRKVDNMQVDFIASVSHELKTPLTSIKGYTETLLDGAIEDRNMTMDFLNIINSETDRMNRLVKDLMQLSLYDLNKQKWEKKDADIVALVRIAAKKMGMLAKSKRQRLNFFGMGEGPLIVYIDEGRIEQVVINVIGNAIKYTKENGRIDIGILRNRGYVHITVTDNGIGIPEKKLSRVFERFFKVDESRSADASGTGLGLSISKQIVRGHGGDIRIESKFGYGTRVIISLPLQTHRGTPEID